MDIANILSIKKKCKDSVFRMVLYSFRPCKMSPLKHIGPGNPEIKIINVIEDVNTQRPSEWFRANPNKKPLIKIGVVDKTLDELNADISNHLEDFMFNQDICLLFIYKFLKDMERAILVDEWVSYNVVIGRAGDSINPLDLLDVEEVQSTTMTVRGGKSKLSNDDLALCLLSIHRLTRVTDKNYRALLSRKINDQLAIGEVEEKPSVSFNLVDRIINWQTSDVFNKLVAATDMFFHKFPRHPYSRLRISTLTSRGRDCAALISYGHILDLIVSSDTTELARWIWVDTVAKDTIRIFKAGEELEHPNSYFPYQSDLGLIQKSAYSTIINPSANLFLHMVGAMLGSKRSINARMTGEINLVNIANNALIMAYAHNEAVILQPQFTTDGKALQIETEAEGSGDEDDSDSEDNHKLIKAMDKLGKNGHKWFLFVERYGRRVPIPVKKFGKRVLDSMGDTRSESVGAFVKDFLSKL